MSRYSQEFKLFARPIYSLIFFDLVWNWGIIIASYCLFFYFSNIFTLFFLIVSSGVHWCRLSIIGHDGVHFSLFKSKKLNNFITGICFYPLGVTVSGYRHWHLGHHRHLGTDKDPEHDITGGPAYSLPSSKKQFIVRAFTDLLGFGIPELVKLLVVVLPQKKQQKEVFWLGLFWIGITVIFWKLQLLSVLVLHVISMCTVFQAISRVRNWCEHIASSNTHRLTCNVFWKYVFFSHNTWCHYEHHKWPWVPYSNLPKTRKYDAQEKIVTLPEVFAQFDQQTNILFQ